MGALIQGPWAPRRCENAGMLIPLRADPKVLRLLAGAHDDDRPRLRVQQTPDGLEVTSPAGELTETERRHLEALSAALKVDGYGR